MSTHYKISKEDFDNFGNLVKNLVLDQLTLDGIIVPPVRDDAKKIYHIIFKEPNQMSRPLGALFTDPNSPAVFLTKVSMVHGNPPKPPPAPPKPKPPGRNRLSGEN